MNIAIFSSTGFRSALLGAKKATAALVVLTLFSFQILLPAWDDGNGNPTESFVNATRQALINACGSPGDDVATVQKCLDDGADPNTVTTGSHERRSVLHRAAARGNTKITTLLVARNADVNAHDWDLSTPLHEAVSNDHTKEIILLLQLKADINAT